MIGYPESMKQDCLSNCHKQLFICGLSDYIYVDLDYSGSMPDPTVRYDYGYSSIYNVKINNGNLVKEQFRLEQKISDSDHIEYGSMYASMLEFTVRADKLDDTSLNNIKNDKALKLYMCEGFDFNMSYDEKSKFFSTAMFLGVWFVQDWEYANNDTEIKFTCYDPTIAWRDLDITNWLKKQWGNTDSTSSENSVDLGTLFINFFTDLKQGRLLSYYDSDGYIGCSHLTQRQYNVLQATGYRGDDLNDMPNNLFEVQFPANVEAISVAQFLTAIAELNGKVIVYSPNQAHLYNTYASSSYPYGYLRFKTLKTYDSSSGMEADQIVYNRMRYREGGKIHNYITPQIKKVRAFDAEGKWISTYTKGFKKTINSIYTIDNNIFLRDFHRRVQKNASFNPDEVISNVYEVRSGKNVMKSEEVVSIKALLNSSIGTAFDLTGSESTYYTQECADAVAEWQDRHPIETGDEPYTSGVVDEVCAVAMGFIFDEGKTARSATSYSDTWPVIERPLKYKTSGDLMSGDDVKTLQEKMNQFSYMYDGADKNNPIPENGVFDKKTKKCLKDIQQYMNIYDPVTGNTIISGALNEEYTARNLGINYNPIVKNEEVVEKVHEALKGIYDTVIDHRYIPVDVKCVGMPWLEAGDKISVYDQTKDRKINKTYVLKRVLTGIQMMTDQITAEGKEIRETFKTYSQSTADISGGNSEVINSDNSLANTDTSNFVELVRNLGFRFPNEPTKVKCIRNLSDNSVSLTWKDPSDIKNNKPQPSKWAGTVVVRKCGTPPLHRWDFAKASGGVLAEYKKSDGEKRSKYKTEPLVDDGTVLPPIKSGKKYYYGIFPYDENGHYRYTKVVVAAGGDEEDKLYGSVRATATQTAWNPTADIQLLDTEAPIKEAYITINAGSSPQSYNEGHTVWHYDDSEGTVPSSSPTISLEDMEPGVDYYVLGTYITKDGETILSEPIPPVRSLADKYTRFFAVGQETSGPIDVCTGELSNGRKLYRYEGEQFYLDPMTYTENGAYWYTNKGSYVRDMKDLNRKIFDLDNHIGEKLVISYDVRGYSWSGTPSSHWQIPGIEISGYYRSDVFNYYATASTIGFNDFSNTSSVSGTDKCPIYIRGSHNNMGYGTDRRGILDATRYSDHNWYRVTFEAMIVQNTTVDGILLNDWSCKVELFHGEELEQVDIIRQIDNKEDDIRIPDILCGVQVNGSEYCRSLYRNIRIKAVESEYKPGIYTANSQDLVPKLICTFDDIDDELSSEYGSSYKLAYDYGDLASKFELTSFKDDIEDSDDVYIYYPRNKNQILYDLSYETALANGLKVSCISGNRNATCINQYTLVNKVSRIKFDPETPYISGGYELNAYYRAAAGGYQSQLRSIHVELPDRFYGFVIRNSANGHTYTEDLSIPREQEYAITTRCPRYNGTGDIIPEFMNSKTRFSISLDNPYYEVSYDGTVLFTKPSANISWSGKTGVSDIVLCDTIVFLQSEWGEPDYIDKIFIPSQNYYIRSGAIRSYRRGEVSMATQTGMIPADNANFGMRFPKNVLTLNANGMWAISAFTFYHGYIYQGTAHGYTHIEFDIDRESEEGPYYNYPKKDNTNKSFAHADIGGISFNFSDRDYHSLDPDKEDPSMYYTTTYIPDYLFADCNLANSNMSSGQSFEWETMQAHAGTFIELYRVNRVFYNYIGKHAFDLSTLGNSYGTVNSCTAIAIANGCEIKEYAFNMYTRSRNTAFDCTDYLSPPAYSLHFVAEDAAGHYGLTGDADILFGKIGKQAFCDRELHIADVNHPFRLYFMDEVGEFAFFRAEWNSYSYIDPATHEQATFYYPKHRAILNFGRDPEIYGEADCTFKDRSFTWVNNHPDPIYPPTTEYPLYIPPNTSIESYNPEVQDPTGGTQMDTFEDTWHIYYSGSSEGAPWGAKNMN